eukprot:TRINITY_DN869_c0_g1_i1.p1 TRINITY_DN869_c0_g1~~TRINITY_DN869_c0_g1_i1.p1  ORF type:complete len:667 (+),score=173.51 TRINITY_DN869_c0_g1_i1:68-2068(+)
MTLPLALVFMVLAAAAGSGTSAEEALTKNYMHGQARDYVAEYNQYMNEQAQKYELKFGDFKAYMHDKGHQWQQKYADYQKDMQAKGDQDLGTFKQWMDKYASDYSRLAEGRHASASPAQPVSFVASNNNDLSHRAEDQSHMARHGSQQTEHQSQLPSAEKRTWQDRYATDFKNYMHSQAKDYVAEYNQYMNEQAQKYELKFGDFKTYMRDKGQQWQQKYAAYQKLIQATGEQNVGTFQQWMDRYGSDFSGLAEGRHASASPAQPVSFVASDSKNRSHQAKNQSHPAKQQRQQTDRQSPLPSAETRTWQDRYATDFKDYMHGQAKDYAAAYKQYMNEQAKKYKSKFGDFKTYMHDKGQQWQQKYADYQKYVKEQAQRTKRWMDMYAAEYEHFLESQHQKSMRSHPSLLVAESSDQQPHQEHEVVERDQDTDFKDYIHGQAKDYVAEFKQYMNEQAQNYQSKFGDFKSYMHDKSQQWQQKYADYQKYVKDQAQRTKQWVDEYASDYERFLESQRQNSMRNQSSLLVATISSQQPHQEHGQLQREHERQQLREEQQEQHSKLVEEQHELDRELAKAEAKLRKELQRAKQIDQASSSEAQDRSAKKKQQEPAPASLFVASLGERSPPLLTSAACLASGALLAVVASAVHHQSAGFARRNSDLAAPLAASV